ncbi:MAG: domain containing protein [Mycobacterium sp.]|nr:domain containing protein [Mycobacterium sp.]
MHTDVIVAALAVLLVVVAALLATAEAALGRATRVLAEELQRQGRRGADTLVELVAEPARALNLLLLLRVIAEMGAAASVTVLVVGRVGDGFRAIGLATAVMTVVSFVAIGVAGRTVGKQQASTVALRSAKLVAGLVRVLGPLPRLLILLGNALTPGRGYRDGPFASEAELRDLVDQAQERGLIEREERDLISGVFSIGDTLVREVMVPRPDVVYVEADKTVRQALNLALRSGFSRLPVVGENIDDITGVAYLKDLARWVQEDRPDALVSSMRRDAVYVPDTKPVDALLREMQSGQQHLAVVIDEYGGTAGLVTIEDILEEIVGEISDEYDRETPPFVALGGGAARVTARLTVADFEEEYDAMPDVDPAHRLGTQLSETFPDVETVGGLLASVLGRVPIPGAVAYVAGLSLQAESTAGRRNRVGTVLVRPVEDTIDDAAGGEAGQGAGHRLAAELPARGAVPDGPGSQQDERERDSRVAGGAG